MELHLSRSFKLFHPHIPSPTFFFLSKSPRPLFPCRLHIPGTSFPTSHTQSCPFISSLSSRFLQSVHISAQPTSSLDLKLHILHQKSFSPSQVKLLQDNPYFLAASAERLSSIISLFRAKDESGALASTLLTRSPCILRLKAERLEAKCNFFQDLGIGSLDLQGLLTNMHTAAVLSTSLKTLQKHIDFLQRIGLSEKDVLKVIRRYPRILCPNIDSKMEATMAFFERHGLSKHDFLALVRVYPRVFGRSIDRYLTKRVEILRGLGLNFPSWKSARALIVWTTVSRERLLSGWGSLKDLGFSEADILKMVLHRPQLLQLREDGIKRKIDYLKNVLSLDVQDVTRFPEYLCLSLENRIIPRFTYLNEVKEGRQHTKKLSLKYLLSSSDESFESQISKQTRRTRLNILWMDLLSVA